MNILLVEDSRTAILLVEGLLLEEHDVRGFQFNLTVTKSLGEAQEALKEKQFDLILLDLTLPDSEGLNTVDAVVQAAPDVAIVVLTSLQEESLGLEALKKGAQDFLIKDETYRKILIRAVRYAYQRKKAETEIQEARELAEFATRSKSDFIANLSHEFRTPLNAIIGFSDMMISKVQGDLNDKYCEYASDINNSGKYLNGLIGTVLDLSKVEARQNELKEETVDLSDAITLAISKTTFLAEGNSVNVHFEDMGDIPKIHGDGIKIRQVIINLLSNAIKFSPQGGDVIVTVLSDDDSNIIFTVKDHGIGIPINEIEEVLTPFHRSKISKDQHIEGTGLGLPLAKSLIEAHQGKLWLHSIEGKGTEVSFKVPSKRIVV